MRILLLMLVEYLIRKHAFAVLYTWPSLQLLLAYFPTEPRIFLWVSSPSFRYNLLLERCESVLVQLQFSLLEKERLQQLESVRSFSKRVHRCLKIFYSRFRWKMRRLVTCIKGPSNKRSVMIRLLHVSFFILVLYYVCACTRLLILAR